MLLECSSDWIVQNWVWAIRRLIFCFYKFWSMKTQLFVVNDELAHHPVEKWSYYQTTSECLVVHPDSEQCHSNKKCWLWLKAEQTPVTIFLSSKLQRTPWCSVKMFAAFQKVCDRCVTLDGHVGIKSIVLWIPLWQMFSVLHVRYHTYVFCCRNTELGQQK